MAIMNGTLNMLEGNINADPLFVDTSNDDLTGGEARA